MIPGSDEALTWLCLDIGLSMPVLLLGGGGLMNGGTMQLKRGKKSNRGDEWKMRDRRVSECEYDARMND